MPPVFMSPSIKALVAVAIISAIPLLGLAALAVDTSVVRRAVPALIRLAAGALVGAACFDLIPEALAAGRRPPFVVGAVIAGFGLFVALDLGLHRRPVGHDAARRASLVRLNFIGDVVHNAVDGMLIAAGFLTDASLGVLTSVAVAMHELPREFGSFGIFLHGGLSVRRAIAYNAVTGVSALLGAAVTLAIGTRVRGAATALLPLAAGAFLYLALALLREAGREVRARERRGQRLGWAALAAWVGVGMAVTLAARG
jgi:zinc and cadmium transporter